jgi:hypothetical protein
MALVSDTGFQHILRVLNTNVDGRQKVRTPARLQPSPHNLLLAPLHLLQPLRGINPKRSSATRWHRTARFSLSPRVR